MKENQVEAVYLDYVETAKKIQKSASFTLIKFTGVGMISMIVAFWAYLQYSGPRMRYSLLGTGPAPQPLWDWLSYGLLLAGFVFMGVGLARFYSEGKAESQRLEGTKLGFGEFYTGFVRGKWPRKPVTGEKAAQFAGLTGRK